MGCDKLISVYFKQLKGLKEVELTFDKPLTAIMGVNGVGKTTVIHALACLFRPEHNGENYRFSNFFIPNTDSLWKGSELTASYSLGQDIHKKRYAKDADRWSPRYGSRPPRDVYYLGINSCLPEIERINNSSRITYSSQEQTDEISQRIITEAASILNLDYKKMYDNVYSKKHMLGVSRASGLKYSSLSMGTGEQRVIRILDTVLRASKNALILVDELDLLLHVSAFNKLVESLSKWAEKKNLQIIFTTHSLEVCSLTRYTDIIYLWNPPAGGSTRAFEEVSSDLIYELTGTYAKEYCIYVEDPFSANIVRELLKKRDLLSKFRVVSFGSTSNAYVLAAAQVITNSDLSKCLIVLDGDKDCSEDERTKLINKALTGTEADAVNRRQSALSIIKHYSIPENHNPEKFLYKIILETFPHESIIYQAARSINAVSDNHWWISNICDATGYNEAEVVAEIFKFAYDKKILQDFLEPVTKWLQDTFQ